MLYAALSLAMAGIGRNISLINQLKPLPSVHTNLSHNFLMFTTIKFLRLHGPNLFLLLFLSRIQSRLYSSKPSKDELGRSGPTVIQFAYGQGRFWTQLSLVSPMFCLYSKGSPWVHCEPTSGAMGLSVSKTNFWKIILKVFVVEVLHTHVDALNRKLVSIYTPWMNKALQLGFVTSMKIMFCMCV